MTNLFPIVDSTLISAPSSTKNKEKKRDPDAHSVKKGNTWHFGYKAHVGADKDTGLIHHVKITSANIHDVTMVPQLLTEEELQFALADRKAEYDVCSGWQNLYLADKRGLLA